MLFLKYLSDVWNERYEQFQEEFGDDADMPEKHIRVRAVFNGAHRTERWAMRDHLRPDDVRYEFNDTLNAIATQ